MSHSIRVVLKSGYSFSFICEGLNTKSTEGELLGYTIRGATANRPMFIRIENVDAIIDEGETDEGTQKDGGQDDV